MAKPPSVTDKIVSKQRTICEVHREIYDELLKNPINTSYVIELLDEAYKKAKKMNTKLVQYKNNYSEDWWETNKKFTDTVKHRLQKK